MNLVQHAFCHTAADAYDIEMRDIAIRFIHLLARVLKLMRPGGTRSVVAESRLLEHQLLILNR